jgi:N6-adenosine-specific RNA methylase IME4
MVYSDISQIDKEYSIIYADPPWKQSKGGRKAVRPKSSGMELDYQTLSLNEIYEHLLIASEHTTDNSILFLWTIDKYLIEAQQIAESMGYKLHARLIWDKMTGIPAAFTVRFGHEYLLYMYKGKLIPVAKEQRGKFLTVFREKAKRHSQKPDIAYQIIEKLYPDIPKLEMYARNTREGWDSFGNEIQGG